MVPQRCLELWNGLVTRLIWECLDNDCKVLSGQSVLVNLLLVQFLIVSKEVETEEVGYDYAHIKAYHNDPQCLSINADRSPWNCNQRILAVRFNVDNRRSVILCHVIVLYSVLDYRLAAGIEHGLVHTESTESLVQAVSVERLLYEIRVVLIHGVHVALSVQT